MTVKKYNNIYERTIKVKPVVVKSKTYINFNKENNYEGPKLKVGDYVRISKYKQFFSKGCIPNWTEEVFVRKVKDTVPWTYEIDLNWRRNYRNFFQKRITKNK